MNLKCRSYLQNLKLYECLGIVFFQFRLLQNYLNLNYTQYIFTLHKNIVRLHFRVIKIYLLITYVFSDECSTQAGVSFLSLVKYFLSFELKFEGFNPPLYCLSHFCLSSVPPPSFVLFSFEIVYVRFNLLF